MAMDMQALAQLLQQSLDPQQSKQAEQAIRQHEQTPGFSLSLLEIVAAGSVPSTIRLAGALYFKNFIKRTWTDAEGNHKLPEDEVNTIKQQIIGLMISVPPSMQTQLGEAVSIIADSDFYKRWDYLVDDLVSRLSPEDPAVNNGVLQVAHSIFKRWRPLFRSDDLYEEILHVLKGFGPAFLQLLSTMATRITENQSNKEALQQWMQTLNLLLKLFYDLSCQDIPEIFEDNLQGLANFLHTWLVYDNPILHTDDEDESGVLEYVKAAIFDVLILYIQKYEDEFGPFVTPFITSSWNLLTTVGLETKYDILVSKALQFLTAVARIRTYAEAFNDPNVLSEVVEKVLLGNMTLRESDVEMFEDEPIEFIRRDLEGSDSDTRRRAATDFLRALMGQFDRLVSEVVVKYIDHYLQDYVKDKANNWKSKDTAVYLFSSIAAKGASTAAEGVKTLNENVNVLDFFQKNIAEDLTSEDVAPILKVDAIKYVHTFRSQLTREYWHAAFPLLVRHLGSSNYVVHTYAAIAVERGLFLTGPDRQPLIPQTDVLPLAKDLLQHIFTLITKNSAPEKIQENEFLMRCVMRVLIVIKENVIAFTDTVLKNLVIILRIIRHNPSNPRFYYYLFESIGALVRYAGPTQSKKLEDALSEPFGQILQEDVQEFIPYVFQLLAALLESNPTGALTNYYTALIGPLLLPSLWESKGNVPALVRLLCAIISRGQEGIVQNNQLQPILGIFQKLVSSKSTETHAFDLIETIISSFPATTLQDYWVTILQLMLARLANSKTETFGQRFIRFFHLVSAKDDAGLGADFFIKTCDQVQNDVFKPVYLTIILPDTQKLSRATDRKVAVVSFTKILADSEAFVSRYPKGWALTCEALLKLLINPPVPTANDDLIAEHDVDDLSFGVGFTQLNTCRKPLQDRFSEIADVKSWVGQYLKAADTRHSGRISQYVQERLSPEARQALTGYMSS